VHAKRIPAAHSAHDARLSYASDSEPGITRRRHGASFLYRDAQGRRPDARTLRLAHLSEWLKSLVKPIGLLAASDGRAREVLDACRLANIHVPEEIAVLGVNDDEMICEMANPPLSSVIHNARRVGYEAAAMLDRLMSGKKIVADIVVDPLGVRCRQSTDLLAIEDPEISKAVRFIREHACEGIRVDDVLEEVALSRRSLEKRFRQAKAFREQSPESLSTDFRARTGEAGDHSPRMLPFRLAHHHLYHPPNY